MTRGNETCCGVWGGAQRAWGKGNGLSEAWLSQAQPGVSPKGQRSPGFRRNGPHEGGGIA